MHTESVVQNMDHQPSAQPRISAARRTVERMRRLAGCLIVGGLFAQSARAADAPDFAAVQTILNQHCLDCHAAQDPEAKLVMEDFERLMKGGENGAVLVLGNSDESLIVRMIEGKVECDGKKKFMPFGKRKNL